MLKGALYGEMEGVESDLKMYTEIKFSNKGNHRGKYKVGIIVFLVCNTSFFSYVI